MTTGKQLSGRICEARIKALNGDDELGATTFSLICAALAGVLSTKLRDKETTLEKAAEDLRKILIDTPEWDEPIANTVLILSDFIE